MFARRKPAGKDGIPERSRLRVLAIITICLPSFQGLRVEQKHSNEDLDFTMVDYVPLTPSELNGLIGKEPDEILRQIEKISKEKDCITTTRGVFRWAGCVFYPHT
jgi:hypothetical protein